MGPNDFPPHVVELLQRQLSQFGRVGASRIFRASPLAAPLAAAGATPTDSVPIPIQFREPGIVLAAYGQEEAGTDAKYAMTEVRVQIAGSEDIFTDGSAGVFVPFLALFGRAQPWFPLLRKVRPGLDWHITYRNRDTGATATPSFMLAFIADRDLAGR